MVDFRVGQKDARDRWRADLVDLSGREPLELLTGVGRGVYEKPGPVAASDRQRRLRTGSCPQTDPRSLTCLAMAVPLRESPAGGRAEDTNVHVAREAGRGPGQAPVATPGFGLLPVVAGRK